MSRSYRSLVIHLAKILLPTGFLLALAVIGTVWKFGSASHAIAYAQGYVLVPTSTISDLGTIPRGQRVTRSIVLTNLSAKQVRVLGMKSSCSCCQCAEDLPLEVPPAATCEFKLSLKLKKNAEAALNESIELYLDTPSPRLIILLKATVLPVESKEPVVVLVGPYFLKASRLDQSFICRLGNALHPGFPRRATGVQSTRGCILWSPETLGDFTIGGAT